ncbi:MAG: hypothetical protein RLY40_328 [Pseudomonadota bacterium]|jgi:hypothetical protein
MIPPKKNPIFFQQKSLQVFNNFRDFVHNMQVPVTEPSKFKKDAIKLIESLKFIKINLAFIGYAVENKTNPVIYVCEHDFKRGVIRDLNGISIHLNAYHNKKEAQTAFANLVQQFENAIVAMQRLGRLEIFVRQLQYDKNIDCVEARVSKALLFATACMSTSAHSLDQLMAQCQFMPNDDATALFNKAKIFFESYMGQACIWNNKDYLIDISLIKQYLIEVFDVEFPSEEAERIKNLFDSYTLAEKIKYLKSPIPLNSFEICLFLLEEIDKINKKENFKFKHQLIFFEETYCTYFQRFFNSYLFLLTLTIVSLLGISAFILGLIFIPGFMLGLSLFFLILLIFTCLTCDGTNFEILRACLGIVTLPLLLTVFLGIIILSLIVNALIACVACLLDTPPQLFVLNQNLLLAQYIDEYFIGKADLPSQSVIQLLKGYLQKKSELTEKEIAFLEALELGKKNIHFSEMKAAEILKKGITSWHQYRFLQKNADIEIQLVLNDLFINNLLFQGSARPFECHLLQKQKMENSKATFEEIVEFVLNNQVLMKVIKPKDWPLFIEQLANVNYRPALRKFVLHPTHKFVHLTRQIIPYHKDIQKKRQKNYTHTKKTSTTLLSSQRNTPLFGTHHCKGINLVGFLFDRRKCKVKARLLQDSGTYTHGWLGNEPQIEAYQTWIKDRNVIDENLFILKIQGADQTNEVLAQVNKEALIAIVIGLDTPEARSLAILRQTEINKKFSILLPIVFYDSSQRTLKLFEWQDILTDIALQQKKQNLTKLQQDCLKKIWKMGVFGRNAIWQKHVPQTVVYLNSKMQGLKDPDKLYDFYSWALAEQKIKDRLKQKCKQNRFFTIFKGRSRDTLEFYQNSLRELGG